MNFLYVQFKQPMTFAKVPIAFLMVGNHGDISRYLQELIHQIETMTSQQVQRKVLVEWYIYDILR